MLKMLVPTVAILLLAGSAMAEEIEEGGQLYAVQGRKYVSQHEFSLSLGMSPLDAFYKGYTGTFAYTFHFDDLWAWEILSGTYSLNVDTGLKKKLQTEWNVQPTDFPQLKFLVDSNVLFKPFYGKFSLFNDSLVYTELYFAGGAAVGHYERSANSLLSASGQTRVGPDLGVGLRFYLSKTISLRFDFRDYFLLQGSDSQNELLVQAGLGLNIQ